MKPRKTISTLLLAAMVSALPLQGNAQTPTAQNTKEPTPDPKAMAILHRLEAAGKKYATLRAELFYRVEQRLTGDVETRTGWVAFQQETDKEPPTFRVTFQTLQLDRGPKRKQVVDYIFDGHWLTVAKHAIKTMTRYQIAAEGEKVQALRIGKGPFPVPFGQKTEDIVRHLRPSTRKAAASDPPNTDYLLLTPRPGKKKVVNFTKLELWVDRNTNLPVKVRTRDDSKNITTVEFKDIQTHAELQPDLFAMEKPPGWTQSIERLDAKNGNSRRRGK
jgi:outer membrane lipoprotein-sorting protein